MLAAKMENQNKMPTSEEYASYDVSSCNFIDKDVAVVSWKNAKGHMTLEHNTNIFIVCFTTAYNLQGSGDKMTDTAAAPAHRCERHCGHSSPTCDRHHGYSSPLCDRHCGHSSPATTDNAVEPGNQPVLVSVAPIHKKKSWKRKSAHLEREDERAGPSQGEEEEELMDEMETTQSLCLSEHTVTWLLRCWDNGASSLELEGKEAKELRSLSREGAIDKAIGKGAQALSLWR
ncbi:hypothetical protein QYF61_024340 [Mycteria americana]|uniref:Uncharacterized protein n=1 Tax=Mycteria americana TaxID=33587 RepID=A0AAN7N328_MYCAM|nr:hypothetical protein QYF61_024340 [Mycteria americana]